MRAAAAAALLQFLLDYPLGSGRLRGHVQFLLANAGYEHEEGRLQALEMLQQVGPVEKRAGGREDEGSSSCSPRRLRAHLGSAIWHGGRRLQRHQQLTSPAAAPPRLPAARS
jgi:hypothetical protein